MKRLRGFCVWPNGTEPHLLLLNTPAVDVAVACVHAQQAAKKVPKGVMCLNGLEFRRTHDLETLAAMLKEVNVLPPVNTHDLRCLTPYAVEFRYDDEAIHLISGEAAARHIDLLLARAEEQIAIHRD